MQDDLRKPLVTIILPLYRVWDFLGEAIASVKAQTIEDFECLCLDDGSPNDMVARAKALTEDDPRFRVMTFPNAGVAASRNRGLEMAAGDFIAFLDQDDIYHPRFLERMLEALERHQADCVVCDFERITEKTGALWETPEEDPGVIIANPLRWSFESRKDIYNVWQKIYRRSSLPALRLDPELMDSDDAFFTFEMFCRPIRVVELQGRYYGYRGHSQSVTRMAPSGYVLAKLAVYGKLIPLVPAREQRAFRKHVLQKVATVIKDYAEKPYTLEEHREILRTIDETLAICKVSRWRWTPKKHLRYWRYQKACR